MKRNRALTLVELLISLSLVGMIAATAAVVLSAALQTHSAGAQISRAVQDATLAMSRITAAVRSSTGVSVTSTTLAGTTTYVLAAGLPTSAGDAPTTATYTWDSDNLALRESRLPAGGGGPVTLASPVAAFGARDVPADAIRGRLIHVTLQTANPELLFAEYVYPRPDAAQ